VNFSSQLNFHRNEFDRMANNGPATPSQRHAAGQQAEFKASRPRRSRSIGPQRNKVFPKTPDLITRAFGNKKTN
jgi:hypothetical protein